MTPFVLFLILFLTFMWIGGVFLFAYVTTDMVCGNVRKEQFWASVKFPGTWIMAGIPPIILAYMSYTNFF